MTLEQIIFLVVAAATLLAGVLVVTVRNLVHAALWLVATLFGVAVIYALLQAGFLAVVQVVIYIGAIAILVIFAIMLTQRAASDPRPPLSPNWRWGLLLAVLSFGGLFWIISKWAGAAATAPALDPRLDTLQQLGAALVSPNAYVLPFEVASVLLLAALVGSIIIAWEREPDARRGE